MLKCFNEDEENSAIVSYFQYGLPNSVVEELRHQLIFLMMDEPAYDYLRTKEQIGYLVFCQMWNYRNTLGGGFVIQSSKKTPEFMLAKIKEFINQMKVKCDTLSDEDFTKGVNALLSNKKQVDMNIHDVKARMHNEILLHRHDFDRKQQEIDLLEEMLMPENIKKHKEGLTQHFHDLFFNSVKQLTLEMVSDKHTEAQETDFKTTTDKFDFDRLPIKLIDTKEEGIDKFTLTRISTLEDLVETYSQEVEGHEVRYPDLLTERWIVRYRDLETESQQQDMEIEN